MTRMRKTTKLIREGKYAAEVPIDLFMARNYGRLRCRLTTPASWKMRGSRCNAAISPKPNF